MSEKAKNYGHALKLFWEKKAKEKEAEKKKKSVNGK